MRRAVLDECLGQAGGRPQGFSSAGDAKIAANREAEPLASFLNPWKGFWKETWGQPGLSFSGFSKYLRDQSTWVAFASRAFRVTEGRKPESRKPLMRPTFGSHAQHRTSAEFVLAKSSLVTEATCFVAACRLKALVFGDKRGKRAEDMWVCLFLVDPPKWHRFSCWFPFKTNQLGYPQKRT